MKSRPCQDRADGPVRDVAVSADGSVVAAVSEDGRVYGYLLAQRQGREEPMSRKADLEHHILTSYGLIQEYEAILQVSSDPKERVRCERAVQEQWSLIEGYLAEYRRLVGGALPADIAEIASRFSAPTGGLQARGPAPAAIPPLQEATEIRHRYALLIGVRDYVNSAYRPLPHTVYDVIELDRVLRAAGYAVRTLHSDQPTDDLLPTRANVWDALENVAGQTGPGDLLLVYFGGHGMVEGGAAYLIPTDGGRSALRRTAIDLDEFKQAIAGAGAQARILILDACHAGIGRDVGGMDAGFARRVHLEAAGTATLAACRQGEVAYEHDGSAHGAFTYYLLQGLRGAAARQGQPFVTFQGLNDYVTNAVKKWAIEGGRQQWPNASAQLAGDPPLVALDEPLASRGAAANRRAALPPNPFTDTLAIRDPARFVGRTAELRRLQAMLSGGSVVLLGEPKVGKSSLLHCLARNRAGTAIGPLDCMALEDRDDLYQNIAGALHLASADWRTIRRALGEGPLLLMLDELDVGGDRSFAYADLARLRAVAGESPEFRLAVASRTPLKDVFPDPGRGSPAYDFLLPVTLGPLAQAEARRLLSHPWAPGAPVFDAACCDLLLEMAARHPFRLQRAAFHRYEALADPVYDWQAAYRQDVEQML